MSRSEAPPPVAGTAPRPDSEGAVQRGPSRVDWIVAILVALAVTVVCLPWVPDPPHLAAVSTGDAALVEELRAAVDEDVQAVAAVRGTAGVVTASAAVGVADAREDDGPPMTTTTPQEIGSVTKSLTGLLFADAVQRGEVAPTTTLGEVHVHLDLAPDVAAITLEELATHHSGLPSLGNATMLRGVVANVVKSNPYEGHTPESLLDEAGSAVLAREPGQYRYSNLGMALLGWALAERAGVPYPDLLRVRVLEPLGMRSTAVSPEPLPAGRAHETTASGLSVEPWWSLGSGPAGAGAWSTAEDLGVLAAAVATGMAPGQDAVTPRESAGEGDTSGWGWFTRDEDGRRILMNNGATAGGVSAVAVDLASREWVAVTAPSSTSAYGIARQLLDVEVPSQTWTGRWLAFGPLITVFLLVMTVVGVASPALTTRVRKPAQRLNRLKVLRTVVSSVLLVVAVRGLGSWDVVPPVALAVLVFVCTAGLVLLVARWRSLRWPWQEPRSSGAGAGAELIASLAVLGVFAAAL